MIDRNNDGKRITREARLRWIPLGQMRVSPLAQRDENPNRVAMLTQHLDLEQLGNPTVSERDGWYWVIDGQHRIAALKAFGFTEDDTVQCWVYLGLSEQEEAEMFLKLNDSLAVAAFSKFKVGVNAGREAECEIDRVVRANHCVVSRDGVPGAIGAVAVLRQVYSRSGSVVLGRTLRIILAAYGDPGLSAPVIDGIGHLCGRFNGELEEGDAVARLSKAHGGVNGLLTKAEELRLRTGNVRGQCVAAAAVTIINRGRGGKKLPDWWKS